MNEFKTQYLEARAFAPTDTRVRTIRRLAYYIYLALPEQNKRVYYSSQEYPAWRGGWEATDLTDFRGDTYGIILARPVLDDTMRVACLRLAKKVYKHFSSIPLEQLT